MGGGGEPTLKNRSHFVKANAFVCQMTVAVSTACYKYKF